MKKLIVLLAFVALSGSAFSQGLNARFSDGITVSAWSATGSNYGSDSLHSMGRFFLRMGDRKGIDSLGFVLGYADSLRFQIVVRAGVMSGGIARTSDTATVYIGENVAKYYHQVTAAGISQIPWFNIMTATGGEAQSAQFIDVWIRVWHAGTEVQKTLRKITLFPKAYL
jgi:hypothetical protein